MKNTNPKSTVFAKVMAGILAGLLIVSAVAVSVIYIIGV